MPKLNPRQNEAVKYMDGPLLVLAGAGSGKTRVITEKIVHLVKNHGLEPRQIYAVTFTNKAAREMRSRVGKLIKGEASEELNISTFHTLGLKIIRHEVKSLGYKPGFTIFDDTDTDNLLKELLRKDKIDDSLLAGLRWRISDWKNDMLNPEQALEHAVDNMDQRAALLYASYQHSLRAYNAVDFDDLILLPTLLFQEQPEVLDRWQNRIRYMLVDEYQDTNGSQYQLVKQLVGVRQGLTVVGDDDQSIYAWRGARPENLAKLKQDFPRLKAIKLEQNYRSSSRILGAANQLISNNPHVFEKKLWSELGPGDPLRFVECKNELHETETVVAEIMGRRLKGEARYGDFAILYRGNHQARAFETTLRRHQIPYFLSGGTSFFSRAEIKDVMSYLRLLSNPSDDSAFLRIINTPRREIGHTTLEKIGIYATERGISLLAACGELGLQHNLKGRPKERVKEFVQWIHRMQRWAENEDPVKTVKQLLKDIAYEDWIHEISSSDSIAEYRMENVDELVKWIENLHRTEFVGEKLNEIIAHLALQDILERQDEDEGGDRVHMMTLHAAKGLEFPHVYLVGMEEELIPHRSSIEEENIEEERRLAYVGITRAQHSLTMTMASKRKRFGEVLKCAQSRFVDELPQDDLRMEGGKNRLTEEEKQERGSSHLASMKALLGK